MLANQRLSQDAAAVAASGRKPTVAPGFKTLLDQTEQDAAMHPPAGGATEELGEAFNRKISMGTPASISPDAEGAPKVEFARLAGTDQDMVE